ncbi:MAG: hypothetical protein LH617_14025 [Ramlibacter sp.]|nr:hypothetical protein [Ramlibacter sp.]
MLIQILANRPQMLGSIVTNTPLWVWGLLAALVTLGLSQARGRTVTLRRVTFMPVAMTLFSLWGTATACASAPLFGAVLAVWTGAAAAMLALIAPLPPPSGTRYAAATRRFTLRGSWVPLALILGIFMTRYIVNVELAMQPSLARDSQYTLFVGAIYGAFSGIFIGRAARLLRLARQPAVTSAPVLTA